MAPDGDLYVAVQGKGGVVALHDSMGNGHFDVKETIGDGRSTGVALHNGYLYVAKTSSVIRYKMTLGQLKPSGDAEVVVSDLTAGREHSDKGIAFDGKGSLYVNIGAPSNACQMPDRQKMAKGEDPCPLLETAAASGSSTKTSWGRSSLTVRFSPRECGRCRPSPGMETRCLW
jgi:glucose/arabinose dehydrogenase